MSNVPVWRLRPLGQIAWEDRILWGNEEEEEEEKEDLEERERERNE